MNPNTYALLGIGLTILMGVAHAVQIVTPNTSLAYKIADKVLGIGPNVFQIIGYHPNPPAYLLPASNRVQQK